MYKSIIDIRRDLPSDLLNALLEVANSAFDNRAGKVENVSNDPYRFVFEGGEDKFGCLELGMLSLEKQGLFLPFVEAWTWVDEEDPEENTDILALMIADVNKKKQIKVKKVG